MAKSSKTPVRLYPLQVSACSFSMGTKVILIFFLFHALATEDTDKVESEQTEVKQRQLEN